MALDEGVEPPLIASEAIALPLCKSRMAGMVGIGPTIQLSKSLVLPLHYMPKREVILLYRVT